MPAGRAGQALRKKEQGRPAKEDDFPNLIPYHVGGPLSMFSVRDRDGEGWGHCDWCDKYVSGHGCSHCTMAKR
eukprot:2434409-Lingulodinium_polyedra.AAC.1